ncbi:MAG: hypothetical protein V4649_06115 [Bacteroidota bacterium]
MKKTILVCAAALALLASCKKSSTSGPSSTIPASGWKLGSTSYTTAYAGRTGANSLSAMDAIPSGSSPNTNTMNAFFATLPTTGGTYRIVAWPATTPLTAGQVGLTTGLYATSTTYRSTGTDAVDATVTVTGGKIKIEVPEVWVKTTTGTDSAKLTGTITEQ